MLKRFFDLSVALTALVVLSPVILIIALVVALQIGRPVLFQQERPGLHGRPFKLLKFRTMTEERDLAGLLLSDEKRLTNLGRWLRANSLDELPQLWNVLRGDLSLVGPRPLLMAYLDRYTPEEARRHEVKPGLTGLAQVEGRNAISWQEKFRYDIFYVENKSFILDLKIVIRTIMKVLLRKDINNPGSATMPEFLGHENKVDLDGNNYIK